MRKLIYISLLALAGCTTSLSPAPTPPAVTGSDVAGYFWHDSTYHYQSSAGNQTISVQGAAITDNNAGTNTTFMVTIASGAYSMSGFSPSDIFGFEPSLLVVADTNMPGPRMETIHSIATVNSGFGARLHAASDSVLYEVNLSNFSLQRLESFPRGFLLAEDAQNQVLFAYKPGGDSIMWTSDDDCSHWTKATTPTGITAFTSTGDFSGDRCWFACGQTIYRISGNGTNYTPVTTLSANVIAIAWENDGVAAGLDNNTIYDVPKNGLAHYRQAVPSPLAGLTLVTSGFFNPILAGTQSGVYSISAFDSSTKIDNGSVSTIYSTGSSIFAGLPNSVIHYNASGSRYDAYANPTLGVVTQFAHPTGFASPSQGIYALSGSTIYRLDTIQSGGSKWTPANQGISAPPAFMPGSLTLLTTDTTWIAGFIEHNAGGTQRGYAYYATSSGPFPQYAVGGVTYNNVLRVDYTSKANGMADTAGVPQYNIYFEKGIGPAVIVRSEGGKTTTTQLVK